MGRVRGGRRVRATRYGGGLQAVSRVLPGIRARQRVDRDYVRLTVRQVDPTFTRSTAGVAVSTAICPSA